jgi:hypothetical protein
MLTIAEATDAAVALALQRHWLARLAQHRPPHEDAPAEAVAGAGDLARVLTVLGLLRGTKRDVRGMQRRAVVLSARLDELGVAMPAS